MATETNLVHNNRDIIKKVRTYKGMKSRNLERPIIGSKANTRNVLEPNRESTEIRRPKITYLFIQMGKLKKNPKKNKKQSMNRSARFFTIFSLGKVNYLPKIPFSTDIRANPEMGIESCLLHQLYKSNQIVISLKIVLQQSKQVRTFLMFQ